MTIPHIEMMRDFFAVLISVKRDLPCFCVDIYRNIMACIKEHHVFIVEDEPEVYQAVANTLAKVDLSVTCFDSGIDCLMYLSSHRCDLIITDLKLPKMDGIELMRRVRVLTPWIPVLIITAYGDIPTAVKAVKAGATDVLEKPLDNQSFVKKVKALLPKNRNHKYLGKPLTRCERTVMQLVLEGKSNKEIAELLNRSRRTIEVHRASVMRKLGAESVIDLLKCCSHCLY